MATTTSSSTSSLGMAGLASGIDWTSIINAMVADESKPITLMQTQETTVNSKNSDWQTIGTDLTNLQTDITKLSSANFFQSTTTFSSASTVANSTAEEGTPVGTYSFSVSQLATATKQNGSTVTFQPVSSTDDVSDADLNSAGFAETITAGTFTVDGKTITVASSDSLESVFEQISNATSGAVTASYDSTTDEITLSSDSAITLGSSADTSNFLDATQLYSNGTTIVTSLNALAGIDLDAAACNANLSTAINDGGDGDGAFEINGVTINFNASRNSIDDILESINSSEAGVTATYDGANNRFVLTNNNTGNTTMTMADVTGNFLAATGLSSGTEQVGNNLQYSLNGSKTLTSKSNTVDATTAGLSGLSVTALATGSATIAVNSDITTIANAITNFVNDYNTVQNYISSQTTISTTTTSSTGSTDSTATTSAVVGVLMGDMDAESITTNLRHLVDASPLAGAIQNLNDLGITSDGTDNLLTGNSIVLNEVLAHNLSKVSKLFTDPTIGLATTVGNYLTDILGSNGVVDTKEANLSDQYSKLADSITSLQTKITKDESNMENEFVEMENAINTINIEKEYLTAYFDSTTTASAAPTAASSSSSS